MAASAEVVGAEGGARLGLEREKEAEGVRADMLPRAERAAKGLRFLVEGLRLYTEAPRALDPSAQPGMTSRSVGKITRPWELCFCGGERSSLVILRVAITMPLE